MEQLFPAHLIPRDFKTDQELQEAFSQHPDYSWDFLHVALYLKDVRSWYEANWQLVAPYLDERFVNRFRSREEFPSRAWELCIAAILLYRGHKLIKKNFDEGPDFCVQMPNGHKMWIEAITCTAGNEDPVSPRSDLEPNIVYVQTLNIEEDSRPRVLRITHAIREKYEKLQGYISNGTVDLKRGDYFVVAVNGALIEWATDSVRLFSRAVLGQGLDVYVRDNDTGKLMGPQYRPEPVVAKRTESNVSINTNIMESPDYSAISAVLYGGHYFDAKNSIGRDTIDELICAYHCSPINPLPVGSFNFGWSLIKDPKIGTIERRPPKNNGVLKAKEVC